MARYHREKRLLRFVLMDVDDLSSTLRQHGNFEFKFKDYTTSQLMLSTITVRNTGNCSLRDISITVKLPGYHPFAQISCSSDSEALASEVRVTALPTNGTSPEFAATLPFFNPNERFSFKILYDGPSSVCEISCRLPDTAVSVLTVSDLIRLNSRRDRWKTLTSMLLAAALACGGALLGAHSYDVVKKRGADLSAPAQ
ncbi:hypothetical protein [Bradyrhizobium sp. CCGUVB14]|uniref:hypothetical protein n=1 Tax=Bradyrhizobium sp. CCGUVB14 TaxID=2949628 RepID=UPI0020B437C4|nr:hypothetical protein [Bradyrhizobium sp. CCGUVB14]MCP3444081.1 hypothetical protein [Bradyrhizobium sp. CCGUVB14]